MITADELLRRCLIYKIYKEWDTKVEATWQERRWYKIYKNKYDELLPVAIERLPNGFFESLAADINQVIGQKLHMSKQELSLYTISGSSLKRLLGKNKDNASRSHKKKEGLAIYVGYQAGTFHFDHWDDFYRVYLDYSRFWDYWQKNAFNNSQLLSSPTVKLPIDSDQAKTENYTNNHLPIYSPTVQLNLIHAVMQDPTSAEVPHYTSNTRVRNWLVLVVVLLLGGAAAGGFWLQSKTQSKVALLAQFTPEQIAKKSVFTVVKQIKGKNKSTVFVAYDVSQLPIDTVVISSRHHADITPRIYRSMKKQDTISFIINKPNAAMRLRGDRVTLRKLRVYQESTGWIGWIHANKTFVSAYLPTCELIRDSALVFPIELVPDQYKAYYFSILRNNRHYGVDGNYHTFEVKVKLVTKPIDATCNHFHIHMEGSKKNEEEMPFGIGQELELDGCEYWLSPKRYPKEVVSKFTHDLDTYRQWNTLKWVAKGEELVVYWNNEKIYTQAIPKNIGEITGLNFSGKGSWAVKWVRLLDKNGKQKYYKDFINCQ